MTDPALSKPTLPDSALGAPPPAWSKRSWLSLVLIALITLADTLTPSSLVVGTLLCAPVALSALGGSRAATLHLLAVAVGGNLLAAAVNALRDGLSPEDLGNRVVSILAALLVGGLTLRAREASLRAARLEEEGRRLERERALRRLVEAVSGPYGQEAFVARAAQALRELTGAKSVELGRVDRAVLRPPHALVPGPGSGRLGSRLPLEFLARPPGSALVWGVDGAHTLLSRLTRPADQDLLLIVTGASAPPDVLAEAVQTLQPLLDRTALLDDLQDRQAQLQARGEVLQDLIYAFSHDLRTPLMANAVNMRAALKGAYGPLPEDYRATLHNGLEANAALLALADQLLLVAKYESGNADEPRSVALRDVVLGVTQQVQPRAQARGVTLETTLEGVRVRGQPHDLRRAVQNLLDNAVRFAPPGSTVQVKLRRDGEEVALSVMDDGPGVPAGREATLFQRFRAGGAGGGTGLGLYLTRRIAEAHGGHVTYTRTARAQSVFTLTLPLEDL
ncbi:sensor histidine kinase [Deinococcus multiflagellatus]|uniref:sensor histidine kinase n=1 Tax=Deinococcus multiflagellatus TaxID=1656887 RepID=UPI001CCDB7FA|nr:ATP-binding protein [Deinococcus multiflagellatus]MBZ9713066.1 HAMP domain-containing histidine kinase [Deinococcus multiflagellatus]